MAAARAAWRTDVAAGVGGLAPERLVFLDERGVLTGTARLYGRGPRGERARGAVPLGPRARPSVLGALGHGGVPAAMSVEGATSGAVFHAYLERVLLPALREREPDAVLVRTCREFRVWAGMMGAKEPRMPRRKEPMIPDALLDQLLAGADPKAAFDPDGLLDELKKALAERALNAEMDHHLDGDGRKAGQQPQRLRQEDACSPTPASSSWRCRATGWRPSTRS